MENKISDLILQGTDVDSVWRKFRDSILLAISQHVSHKMSRKHLSLPWITTQLRRQIRRRNILYCRAKHLGSTDIYNKFLDLKHSIQRDLRKSYWQYINGLISFEPAHGEHQKQKKFWSYIKSLKKDHARISSLNTPDGLVTDDTQKAEALNTQFKCFYHRTRWTSPMQTKDHLHIQQCPRSLLQLLELANFCRILTSIKLWVQTRLMRRS